jgi:hypothetical protein
VNTTELAELDDVPYFSSLGWNQMLQDFFYCNLNTTYFKNSFDVFFLPTADNFSANQNELAYKKC